MTFAAEENFGTPKSSIWPSAATNPKIRKGKYPNLTNLSWQKLALVFFSNGEKIIVAIRAATEKLVHNVAGEMHIRNTASNEYIGWED